MARNAQDVTDAELAVLQVLWARGATTIRRITEVVYPNDVQTQYSTVKRLLTRLEAKGLVQRDRNQAVHVFEAVVDRNELVGRRLKAVADSLCDGSISPLLIHLAKSEGLSEKQQRKLQSLIAQFKRESERNAGPKRTKPAG